MGKLGGSISEFMHYVYSYYNTCINLELGMLLLQENSPVEITLFNYAAIMMRAISHRVGKGTPSLLLRILL